MIIQFNTDHNIDGTESFAGTFTELITTELSRYSSYITRVEAHLADEDGSGKDGKNDIRCVLEARLEGRQPIAVTTHADTHYSAVEDALEKLKASLNTITGKMKEH